MVDCKNRLNNFPIEIDYPGANNFTSFTFDGLWRNTKIVETTAGSITSTKQLVWSSDSIRPYLACEERDASSALTKKYFEAGEAAGVSSYFYTQDYPGSNREMTDSSGVIQAQYSYDPYGRVAKLQGSMESEFQYTGHYYHARSNMSLALYRNYNANLARWISRDPEEPTVGNNNLYTYVINQPINLLDPDGKEGIGGVIGGAIGGIIGGLGGKNPASIETGIIIGEVIGSGVGDVIVVGTGIVILYMGQHGKQKIENEYTREAKKQKDPCQWLCEQYSQTKDPKERLKIKKAQKDLGCRTSRQGR
ncbi:MAG: RHS repeat-associated core domain-containing protein [Candidatus Melainabacteria bacterium]|nr:RHS repeat-associated core domain-containing protein [Candidatus Melainabacteria bacterium]